MANSKSKTYPKTEVEKNEVLFEDETQDNEQADKALDPDLESIIAKRVAEEIAKRFEKVKSPPKVPAEIAPSKSNPPKGIGDHIWFVGEGTLVVCVCKNVWTSNGKMRVGDTGVVRKDEAELLSDNGQVKILQKGFDQTAFAKGMKDANAT